MGGQTVVGLYNGILGCTRSDLEGGDPNACTKYVTAKRYAVEIGGNDYVRLTARTPARP